MIRARFRLKPFRHQLREYVASRDLKSRALLWHMRTGKTKVMVDTACYLYESGKIDGVLVLAQNGVHANWTLDEIPTHSWADVPWLVHRWSSSPPNKQSQQDHDASLARCLRKGPWGELHWLCLNTEALILPRVKKAFMSFLNGRRILLVVDESHDYRTPGSKRSKRVRALARRAAYRRILTGTVVSNTPLAAFAQFEILQKGALGFETYGAFEQRYAEYEMEKTRGGRTFPTLKGYRNLDELKARMARYSSVVLREDCEDMPQLLRVRRRFDLTPGQMAYYEQLRETCAVILRDESEPVTRFSGGVMLTKLQQVASGYVVDEEGAVVDVIPPDKNPRLDVLMEEVRDAMDKVVIWCRFREDIKRVVARLKREKLSHVVYMGGMSEAAKLEARTSFQNERGIRCFVGQPQSGGVGIPLHSAGAVIWYSHVFDLIYRDQASERASKAGKSFVNLIDIVATDTVDPGIIRKLDEKRSISDALGGAGLRDFLLELIQGETYG